MEKDLLRFYFSQCKKEHDSIKPYYDDVRIYTKPYFTMNQMHNINKQTEHINLFILNCIEDFCNYIMNTMLPRGSKWGKADIDKELFDAVRVFDKMNSSKKVEERALKDLELALEHSTDKLFKYLNSSNYFTEIYNSVWDCVTLGTGVFRIVNNNDIIHPFRFKRETVDDTYLSEDENGNVKFIFKLYKHYNYNEFISKYPSATWVDADKHPERKIDFYEYVVPTNNGLGNKFEHGIVLSDMETHLFKETLDYSPLVVFRFRKHDNLSYGVGQGMWCIDYFKGLTELARLDREQVANFVSPPLVGYGDKLLFNSLAVKAGKLNYGGLYGTPNMLKVEPVIPPQRLETIEIQMNELKDDIRKSFLTNPLGDITDTQNMTATEAQIRSKQFRDTFSGVYERLITELLEPIFLNSLRILCDNNITELSRQDIDITKVKFINDIAEGLEFENINKLMQVNQMGVALIGESFPQLFINRGRIRDYLVEKTGIDVEPINTNEEIAVIIGQQQQAIDEQYNREVVLKNGTNKAGTPEVGGTPQNVSEQQGVNRIY